jgi:hypothetical protein
MKKFDSIVNRVFTDLLTEQPAPPAPPPGLDQTGGPQGQPPMAPPAAPAPAPMPADIPDPEKEQKPKPLSSPGRAFLVDLIRRALEIDPKSMDDSDMGGFADDEVTIENASEIEKKLASIINRLNPAKID